MNDPNTISLLWDYMCYADRQVQAATATLTDEGYFKELGISFGSVHSLLVHCCDAQRIWLQRIKQAGNPKPVDPRSVKREDIAQMWEAVDVDLLTFAKMQTRASLETVIHSVNRAGVAFSLPMGLCMLHVADHATYHRGQLNSMIKLAAGKPSPVMLFSYGLERGFGETLA